MLRSLDSLNGYSIQAEDGTIGRTSDFYFDDLHWTLRYAVVATGSWLSRKEVLLAPAALGDPDWTERILPVELTRKQIQESPDAISDLPVSRQQEAELARYFHWPAYWLAGETPVASPTPAAHRPQRLPRTGDPTLRSAAEVQGYSISARDGRIGHVEDFIVDDETWPIRYLVVDTRDWLPGKKVLVAIPWILSVSWATRRVEVDLTRQNVEKSPEYDPRNPVNRRYEEQIYDFHGRPHYWRAEDSVPAGR